MSTDPEERHRTASPSEQHRLLAELGGPALVLDGDGVISYANQAAARLFDRAPGDLVGTDLGLPLSIDGICEVDLLRPGLWPLVAEIRRVPLPDQPGCAVFIRDVTEQRRASDELQLLTGVALAAEATGDEASAYEVVLERICRTTGWQYGSVWTPEPDGEGGRLRRRYAWHAPSERLERFHRAGEPATLRAFEGLAGRAWMSGQAAWDRNLGTDSGPRHEAAAAAGLHFTAAVPVLSGADVIAVLEFYGGHARPIEQRLLTTVSAVAAQLGTVVRRKLAEECLSRTADALAERNQDLEHFASVLAHDLKTPLTVLRGTVAVLRTHYHDLVDADGQELIELSLRSADRMQQLIDGLLAFAQVTAAPEPADTIDLDELVGDVAEFARRAHAERDPVVQVAPLPSIHGTASLVRELFENLVGNAVKFVPAGVRPRVRIDATRSPEGWIVTVSDNGPGIPVEARTRIFDIFHQESDEREGSGIGLAVCKRIADRHGGRIWVDAAELGGAAVHVLWPAPPALGSEA